MYHKEQVSGFAILFTDVERLKSMTKMVGPFQVIYAGKAHPQDQYGKELIQRFFQLIY